MHLSSERPGKEARGTFFSEKADVCDSKLTSVTLLGTTKPNVLAFFLRAVSSERPERARPSWAEAAGVGMDSQHHPQ